MSRFITQCEALGVGFALDDFGAGYTAFRYFREFFFDIVKIDVEGYELMVLRGFGEAIRNVRVLQFEFGGTNIDTKVFFRDLWRFFEEAGFDLYRITPLGVMRIEHYHERDELFIIANFIAVNRSAGA